MYNKKSVFDQSQCNTRRFVIENASVTPQGGLLENTKFNVV
jgi:hypothetical protein